jgi:hypothetical protein
MKQMISSGTPSRARVHSSLDFSGMKQEKRKMKFSDLFTFSVKRKVRSVIWKSQDAIEKVERDLQDARSSLAKMQGVPGVELWVIRLMENNVTGMEKTLSELRAGHARFVAENRKPSPAFPRGITA